MSAPTRRIAPSQLSMAAARQQLLQEAWLRGKTGTLCALQQARAWALREVWQEEGKPAFGLHACIARKVTKIGGGHPRSQAVAKFFERVDEDLAWFSGKEARERSGPESVISPQNQATVARAAMSTRKRDVVRVADKVYEAPAPAPASPRRRRPVTMPTAERSPPHKRQELAA